MFPPAAAVCFMVPCVLQVRPVSGKLATPTPPSSGQSTRSRRTARKCATPIKSAEKVAKDERVTLRQAGAISLSDTSTSTATTLTPDSEQKLPVGGGGRGQVVRKVGHSPVCCSHLLLHAAAGGAQHTCTPP